MREIKFRAWSKKEKGWIAGFNMINFHSIYNKGSEPSIQRYGKEWLLSDIEMVQYTGLKDKNGNEIYEGDIVEWLGLVLPISVCDVHGYRFLWGKDELCRAMEKEAEIIGDIHENSDLLSENKNER